MGFPTEGHNKIPKGSWNEIREHSVNEIEPTTHVYDC